MTLSIIAAMARNRVIGRDNRLPWHLPADLARFKQLTMGHWLLVGRKTYDSIGRPLPGRTIVVITRNKGFTAKGVLVAYSLAEAVRMAAGDEVFVAGGAQIYQQALPLARRMYLTILDQDFEGDAFFPDFDPA